jgi:hypothetical protein
MERHIIVRGIKRKEIDEEKLALAFLLLAKTLHEQREKSSGGDGRPERKQVPEEDA